jgi:protein-disulfide isomerase
MTKEHTHSESGANPYILPLSIILASLIVSGAILFAASKFPTTPTGLVVAGTGQQQQAAPNNPPSNQGTGQLNQPTAPTAPTVTNADFKDIPAYRWIGPADAKVTIVEFSDFQCPFCERLYSGAYKQIKTDYVDTGKVRLAFAHFPLSFHPNAQPAANAAECAGEQGKFFEYHNKIFENQENLSDASYKQWAQDLGLNTTQFNSCYDSKKYDAVVEAELALGQRVGVSGTPSVFVNGKLVVGAQPYSTFKTAIDAALAG